MLIDRRVQTRAHRLAVIGVTVFTAACGGGGETKQTPRDTSAAAGAVAPPSASSGASAAGGGLAAPLPGSPPAGATAPMVALGDSVFHGQSGGGTCFTCHGVEAQGTPLGPPLVSHKWLTGDGGYAFIQQRVTVGMPNPTPPYTAPMPPMGGVQLTPDQVKAVAAYVYSISHP